MSLTTAAEKDITYICVFRSIRFGSRVDPSVGLQKVRSNETADMGSTACFIVVSSKAVQQVTFLKTKVVGEKRERRGYS